MNYFSPEVQADFFAPLNRIAADPSVVSRYREMAQLFRLAVDQRVATCTIHFVGLFAKVDYLVKYYDLEASLAHDLHDMRHRLRQYRDLPEEELQRAYPYDLRMLCRFISLIYDRAPIPQALKSRFPLDEMPRLKRRLAAGRLRVIVERWYERYL